jgi:hypothetical protein
LAVIAAFVYALDTTWLKWGDLIIDTFRDLWVPMQLIDGRVLYRDIFYEYGFIPPYILAIIYRIFGGTILTMVMCGILITVLEAYFLFRISRLFMDAVLSGVLTVNVLTVFAFNRLHTETAIFTYILPYSFAVMFFMLSVTIALFCFLRFICNSRYRDLLAWEIFMVLAFLSRPIFRYLCGFHLLLWLAF